ncbi:hypothetical protein SB748_31445, partial [Rhizobium sp. SIMBA_035]
LDIVLAARHTRRLAGELDSLDAVRAHADRLTSQVLGNTALSMAVVDERGNVLARHNVKRNEREDLPPAASGTASPAPPALPDAELFPPHATP